jgi:uncharacterized protein (UPF0332 family)
MSVSPADFLSSANVLVATGTEIGFRNAASRAYYAAYHYCLPTAETLDGAITPKSGLHHQFIQTFIQNGSLKARAIGYILEQCYGLRIKADYITYEEFRQKEAETVIQQVGVIFRKIDELEGRRPKT